MAPDFETKPEFFRAQQSMTPSPDTRFTTADLPQAWSEMDFIARRLLSNERASHTFATDDLRQQTLVKLLGPQHATKEWPSARVFLRTFAAAARNVLIDHARARLTQKRGLGAKKIAFDAPLELLAEDPFQLVAVLELLDKIETSTLPEAALTAEIARLRVLCCRSDTQIARSLNITRNKTKDLWTRARAWIQLHLDA